MVLARRHPLFQELAAAVQVHEDRDLGPQHVAIAAAQRGAGDDPGSAGVDLAPDPVRHRLQPGSAILVGERHAGRHLLPVGRRVQVVALDEVPAESIARAPWPTLDLPQPETPMTTRTGWAGVSSMVTDPPKHAKRRSVEA